MLLTEWHCACVMTRPVHTGSERTFIVCICRDSIPGPSFSLIRNKIFHKHFANENHLFLIADKTRVYSNLHSSRFGGLVVSMLDSGSNPAEAVGFFGRKNPQHAFLRRGSKAVCPMSQICVMLKNPAIYVEVRIAGQIDRPSLAQFRPLLKEVSHCRLTWSASGDDGRN
jgi:hypothetical protein